jgi:hypothetical protein
VHLNWMAVVIFSSAMILRLIANQRIMQDYIRWRWSDRLSDLTWADIPARLVADQFRNRAAEAVIRHVLCWCSSLTRNQIPSPRRTLLLFKLKGTWTPLHPGARTLPFTEVRIDVVTVFGSSRRVPPRDVFF